MPMFTVYLLRDREADLDLVLRGLRSLDTDLALLRDLSLSRPPRLRERLLEADRDLECLLRDRERDRDLE